MLSVRLSSQVAEIHLNQIECSRYGLTARTKLCLHVAYKKVQRRQRLIMTTKLPVSRGQIKEGPSGSLPFLKDTNGFFIAFPEIQSNSKDRLILFWIKTIRFAQPLTSLLMMPNIRARDKTSRS